MHTPDVISIRRSKTCFLPLLSIGWRAIVWRPIYDGPRSRQQKKGRDPGRARWRRKKRGTRMTRKTAMRGQQHPERGLTDPTRTRSDKTMSLMGTRMSIRMPSGAVAVMRRKNGIATEAMETRTESCLSWRRWRTRQSRKILRRRRQIRRGAESRTSCQRQWSFPLSLKILTDTASAGGPCTGTAYRCNVSGRWMEVR